MIYTYSLIIIFLISFIFKFYVIIIGINNNLNQLNDHINNLFEETNQKIQEKLNLCKKKIKDFILRTNTDRYHIKNSVFDLEESLINNYDDFIINLIIIKFPSCNKNFKVIKNVDTNTIKINYYNYSIFFTTNIINEFSNLNDVYPIYSNKSSYISYKNVNFSNNNKDELEVLYKINSQKEIYNFIENYNLKSRYIYIEFILYDIIIDKIDKSYKTVKSTFYIKRNILDTNNYFLMLVKFLDNICLSSSIENTDLLLFDNNDKVFKIIDFYNNKNNTILDNPLEYTYKKTEEYNDFYF